MLNPLASLSPDPDSTSAYNPSTQAFFSTFLPLTPTPLALFHFTMQMLPIEHTNLLAKH